MTTIKIRRRVPTSLIIMVGLGGLLFGLWQARTGTVANPTLMWIFLASLPLIILKRPWCLIIVVAACFYIGLYRGQQTYRGLLGYQEVANQKVEVSGIVANDPAYTDTGQQEFNISHVRIGDKNLPGKLRIRGFGGALNIKRGDRIQATGKLREGFGSYQGSISYAELAVLERESSWLERLRLRFFASVYSAIPEPQASLGLGFLAGTRSLLPDSMTDTLRIVGLTHIVAVSGYNLTILVRFARRVGASFSKRLAAIMAVLLVVGFLAIAGDSPSITRAAVVTAFSLAAWYCGRKVSPVMLLLLSSAITAMVNPLYLWGDLGWWLSFLAFFGILIVAPILKARLFAKKKLNTLGEILLETTSAQLMTVPLIMVVFGELSLISIVANAIVLPLVPLTMLATFATGLIGMFSPLAANLLAWPARLSLSFITEIVDLLARPSWAFVEKSLSSVAAGIVYITVIIIILFLYVRKKPKVDIFAHSVIE